MALMLLSASACGTNGSVSDYCLVAKPIYFAPADRLTDRTERAIIVHNEQWQALCAKR